jgi:nucleoside 2-deoxyribosyltransferase
MDSKLHSIMHQIAIGIRNNITLRRYSMKIYTAHPITGLTYQEIMAYYNDITTYLKDLGFTVLCPMTAKGRLSNTGVITPVGHDTLPISTNQAILGRDHWMVSQADIVLIDLTGATKPSIGCCMELAFAYHMHKHTILVMEDDNPNAHAFTLAAANIIFKTAREAEEYLKALAVSLKSE